MTKAPEVDPYHNVPRKASQSSKGGVYTYDNVYDTVPMGDIHEKAPEYTTVMAGEESGSQYSSDSNESRTLVTQLQDVVFNFFSDYAWAIGKIITVALLISYTIYFIMAIRHSTTGGGLGLIVMTAFAIFCFIYSKIKKHFGDAIWNNCGSPLSDCWNKAWPVLRWILLPGTIIALILYLVFFVIKDLQQLQSVSGMVFFVGVLYLTSKHPNRILWRPVIVGFVLQFVFGILVLRWKPGYDGIKWLSDEIMTFINFALEGAAIVFGDPTMLFHPFVFVIMPMLIYIGAVMSILYYLGVTQVIAGKAGWFMQIFLETTAIETLAVASNIFLNGMDTMLMLRHYLPKLTRSEFHCFLVGNHATVAGFAFATFVMFGAPPQYLISASVMSAPATIAVSKLAYPETEESVTKTQEDVKLEKGEETNVIEASANGATIAGATVVAVVVNYIGFLGLLGFINATLRWIGTNVGFEDPGLSFEWICSYMFYPLSIMMGVSPGESREVAKLVGIKVFTSEMLAYQELGNSITNGLSERGASIATYALCGFSSLSTLAIAVGVWNSVCPCKTAEMANQLPRVIINANISCFITACIAALMFDPALVEPTDGPNEFIAWITTKIPGYESLMAIVGM